ncbi:unnamed protein product, partial [Pleuronectes platessa]
YQQQPAHRAPLDADCLPASVQRQNNASYVLIHHSSITLPLSVFIKGPGLSSLLYEATVALRAKHRERAGSLSDSSRRSQPFFKSPVPGTPSEPRCRLHLVTSAPLAAEHQPIKNLRGLGLQEQFNLT